MFGGGVDVGAHLDQHAHQRELTQRTRNEQGRCVVIVPEKEKERRREEKRRKREEKWMSSL